MASRRWASSAPHPRASGSEVHWPLASGPLWTIASLIRLSAARLGSSIRPMIPAMPHIPDTSKRGNTDHSLVVRCPHPLHRCLLIEAMKNC